MKRPRTVVHFPRMKVRGRRNKAKLAARYQSMTVIPNARPRRNLDGSTTFDIISAPEPGSVRLEFTTVRDGYGRTIPSQRGVQ